MTQALRSWIFGIVGAAFIAAVTQAITPENRARRVVSIVCGFVMLLAIIGPIKVFDYSGFRQSLSRYSGDAAFYSAQLDEVNENIMRAIIEEQYAAYILDKSDRHGVLAPSVTVTAALTANGEYWYPTMVEITAEATAAQRSTLEYELEVALGVPPGEIIWSEGRGANDEKDDRALG